MNETIRRICNIIFPALIFGGLLIVTIFMVMSLEELFK